MGRSCRPQGQRRAAALTTRQSGRHKTTTFTYKDHASFPGTIIIGKYVQTKSTEGGLNINVYTTPEHKEFATQYADTATKEFFFFTTTYGPPFNRTLSVVELPERHCSFRLGAGDRSSRLRNFTNKGNYRLLANTISHQWFGTMVSPRDQERLVAE